MAKITKQPGIGALYTFTEYFYSLFMTNFYFLLCNILFILALFTFDIRTETLIVYTIAAIPIGPSLAALFACMGKLIRDKEITPTPCFFNAYRENFKASMKLWSVVLLTLFLLLVDVNLSSNSSRLTVIRPVLIGLIFLVSIVSIRAFSILSRFEMNLKDLIAVSIYYFAKKLPKTIISILVVVGIFYFSLYVFNYALLFSFSLSCFIIMFNDKAMFAELEDKQSDQTDSSDETDSIL